MNHNQIVTFIWGVADLIRDSFRRGRYQDVILPFTVLRRLDCVLAPTKDKVLQVDAKMKTKGLDNPDAQLRKASGYAFYNTSKFDFEKLLGDAPGLHSNLLKYIGHFSPNMREVLDRFDFPNTIAKLDEAGLLFKVVERFKNVDLHPNLVDNPTMGTIFEELIRKFNEALNENPGEHFTPRDVVSLMVDLLLSGDEERLAKPGVVVTICDPCSGSGGMLTLAKDHINGSDDITAINPDAKVFLFGQEVNPQTYAICKSDLYMKSEDGRDGENIAFGSTLDHDGHAGRRFDYLIANPPYGKDWKADEEAVRAERDRGEVGRFPAGLPRISDGQLLFLQHMVSRMAPPEEGGARVAIIMNGSPLFTGDAGSGESEIRRWVLENDWLEAIIAMPEQLFYNTGIATYVWILSNRKSANRKGQVQLIDAKTFWKPMQRSLGDKRRRITPDKAAEILALYEGAEEAEHSKVFDSETFGYRKITVERPLRLNFQASPERIARLDDFKAFSSLSVSKKKDDEQKAVDEAEGRKRQDELRMFLGSLPDTLYKDRAEFLEIFDARAKGADLKLSAPLRKAVLGALSERDEEAAVCVDGKGNAEPDPELRDYENVPLSESVHEFFDREVKPYLPDAWINESVRDPKDDELGKVGYEVNFKKHFFQPEETPSVDRVNESIKKLQEEIRLLLQGVTG